MHKTCVDGFASGAYGKGRRGQMHWTLGSLLFYSGIAGLALTAIASAVAALVGKSSRKKLLRKLSDEYGESH